MGRNGSANTAVPSQHEPPHGRRLNEIANGIPIDGRLVVACIAVIVAGIAKGVTGMGLPVIGVPILVALYGDLRFVLPLTVIANVVSDVVMLVRYRRDPRELTILVPFCIAGLVGIVLGTQLLTFARPAALSALLAAVIGMFLVVSWLGRMPVIGRKNAFRYGPLFGFAGGAIQGAAGASGPIVTSYLMSMQLERELFLFAINVVFAVLDSTQGVSVARLGLFDGRALVVSAAVTGMACASLAAGQAIQKRIDDRAFRRGVLVLLTIAVFGLVLRAVRG